MKIKKLNLTNFRSHADTTLDNLPRVVCVRGANHSGKTSLVQALELALAGRAAPTDDRGAGAKDLIRTGAEGAKAVIKLRLQNDPTVEEFRDVRCSLTQASGRSLAISKPDDKDFTGSDFAYWLNANRDILSCLINGQYFIGLKDVDQKALLAGIVLPETYEWRPEILPFTQELGIAFNPAARPFETIAAVYKQAFEMRRDINRDIKAHVTPEGDTTAAGEVDDLRTQVKEHTRALNDLLDAKVKIENAVLERESKLKILLDQRERASAKLSTEQQQVETFRKHVLSKAILKTAQELAARKDRAVELDAQIIAAQTEHDLTRQAFEEVQRLEYKQSCPRCRQAITPEIAAAMAAPLVRQKDALGEKLHNLRDERKAIGDYEAAVKDLARHEQAKIDLKRSEERVVEAHTELAGLNTQIEGIGPVPEVAEELLEEIKEAKRRAQDASDRIEPVVRANALVQQKADAQARLKSLTARQAKLQKLVDYFGPGEEGIQAKLLSHHIGGFQTSMNKVLARWGYECALQFEPYTFAVKRGDVTLPLAILSESEKHQFAIAFQVALATHSGLLFAVVDASEIYDTAGRKHMFAALLNAGLDQVFILGTDQREEIPDLKDANFYMFENTAAPGDIVTTSVRRLHASPAAQKGAAA